MKSHTAFLSVLALQRDAGLGRGPEPADAGADSGKPGEQVAASQERS